MKEIWKSVTIGGGVYKDKYEVSNFGRLRRYITAKPNNFGYMRVRLSYSDKFLSASIHEIMAHEFIGHRPKGMDINHKDGDKKNNSINNIEYCTRAHNIQHAYKIGLNPTKLTVADIKFIRSNKKLTQCELAKRFNVCQKHISTIINNKYWKNIK